MENTLSAVHAISWLALLLATAISAQQPGTSPTSSLPDEEAAKLPYTYSIAGFEDRGTFTLIVGGNAVRGTVTSVPQEENQDLLGTLVTVPYRREK
jgi:hypothetical protein